MDEAFLATKCLIEEQVTKRNINISSGFKDYGKVYVATNENINGYMSRLDFSHGERALAVLASGDFAFNTILNGILDVDTFDVNKLTEYFALGLKRSAILTFNYQEYISFMKKVLNPTISLNELSSMIAYLLPNMDIRYRSYWQKVLDCNYKAQKHSFKKFNLFYLLLINIQGFLNNFSKNSYLISEENYNILRANLSKANITFRQSGCLSLPDTFSEEYDFIFLSNIADYLYSSFGIDWGYPKLEEFKNKLKVLLRQNGAVALAYAICCSKNGRLSDRLIQNSSIKPQDLTTEELLLFPHIVNDKSSSYFQDGIILERRL